jgi:hypothetical protein
MNIPNFQNLQFVTKELYLTDVWLQILTQLFSEMQANLSNQGFVPPSLDGATIGNLASVMPNGTLIWNTTLNELVVRKNDGAFHVIQTL